MHVSPVLTLFLQIGLILSLARSIGWVFTRFQQPQVMGEMLAGILLGPSVMGILFPQTWAVVFPGGPDGESVRYLNVLSNVGIVFFLFLVGLELDPKLIRNRGKAALIISHVSMLAPFLLGAVLTLYLYPRLFNAGPTMGFTSVALFMGAAMSITAFPVLARILTERNLTKTKVGAVAITCAAANDVTAWCMLALVVGVARLRGTGAGMAQAGRTIGLSAAYVVIMFLVVRPMLRRLETVYDRRGRLSQNIVSLIFVLILASSYTTEWIGIHSLFGAFLLGAIMPKGSPFVRHLSEKLEDYTVVLLLPIFFAFTGLRTQIGLLSHQSMLGDTGLIILVATLGKFGGATVSARFSGMNWRESSAIGVLMNTRGLMELIILNIGKDLGVITDAAYAMMVVMAIITTFFTTPILQWIYPMRMMGGERNATGPRTTAKGIFSILIPVSLPKSGAPLVQLADTLISGVEGEEPAGKVLALHLRRPADHAAFRSGLDEADDRPTESLAPLLAQARARSLRVEPMTFISTDIPSDIIRVARDNSVSLVLMGFHKPVIGKTILGGTVHRVMTGCEADVAVFVDRGLRQARRILVPYLGSAHDRLALELAGRMARNTDAAVTVLHVVAPMRSDEARQLDAKQAVDQVFHDPTQPTPVTFRVIEDPSPVGVILHQAPQFDLVVAGVAEEWGLESHLFGWRGERIARDCPSSLLVVRKFLGHAIKRQALLPAPENAQTPS